MIDQLKKLLVGFVLISLSSSALAQEGTYYTVRDFETWTSATLNYKLNKKLKVSLTEQLRLKDNSSIVDKYFTQLELNYKVIDHLTIGGGLRYSRENDNKGKIQGYENHLRWNTDLEYKHDISRFTMKYRFRYQNGQELNTLNPNDTKIRLKVASTYNIRKWKFDPTFSAEVFNGLSSNEGFNKIRLTLGTEYETKKAGDIGIFFRMEKDLIGTLPKTTNILGFKYNYTLKKKKNEK